MSDDLIREYISTTSRRASAIVTTLSTVYLLYLFGWVEFRESGQLFGGGVAIKYEYLEKIAFIALLVSTTSWAARFRAERLYAGEIQQTAVLEAKNKFDRAKVERRDANSALIAAENNLLTEMNGNQTLQSFLTFEERNKVGEKITLDIGKKLHPKPNHWDSYIAAINVLNHKNGALFDRELELKRARSIESQLSLHSKIVYVWAPALISAIGLAWGSLRLAGFTIIQLVIGGAKLLDNIYHRFAALLP